MNTSLLRKYLTPRWALGFVRGGMTAVMESDQLQIDWVKMPKDRWYADPFILEVTDKEIQLLVEDFGYRLHKGIISLLHIDRATMTVTARKELLELPTHLSFPAILRKDGHIYVYPESMRSGKLTLYEYHPETESLTHSTVICDDPIWDSVISDLFGEPLLFTAAHDDFHLDIYQWEEDKQRFVPYQSIPSTLPDSRLGGSPFAYKKGCFYPAQNCIRTYGAGIDIKKLDNKNGEFHVTTVKQLTSPHPDYPLGMHTLNEYKGVVVIDVKGYPIKWLGALREVEIKLKKRIIKYLSKH